jgi:RNA polymerase I-specific transcription initiation factor RRN3
MSLSHPDAPTSSASAISFAVVKAALSSSAGDAAQGAASGGSEMKQSAPAATPAQLAAVLQQFVLSSLQAHARGDSKSYNTLISQLTSSHLDKTTHQRWFTALSRCVALIAPSSPLEAAILAYDMKACSLASMEAFCTLLTNLVIARPSALTAAMRALVRSFLPAQILTADAYQRVLNGDTDAETASSAAADGSAKSQPLGSPALSSYSAAHAHNPEPVTEGADSAQLSTLSSQLQQAATSAVKAEMEESAGGNAMSDSSFANASATMDEIHDTVHRTLARIVRLMPASCSRLFPLLVDNFPHKRFDALTHQVYLKNLLRISEYIPSVRDRVLTAIVERIIHVDVEVELRQNEGKETQNKGNSMREKLDAMMSLLLEYLWLIKITALGSAAAGGSGGASAAAVAANLDDQVFASLLRVFERCILRTHKSRFTQFLIFYYASIKSLYAESFLLWLLQKCFDGAAAVVERQAAACYIASFVSRAAFLRHAAANHAFERLLKRCLTYAVEYQQAGGAAVTALEAPRHAVFYSMMQAVMYIFCFR